MSRNNIKDSLQPKLENIKLDLGTYKILLNFQNHKEPFAIHFDKPARRFYFSLIALVITEMKNLDKPDFIHIRKHENTLKLLDNSLAGQYTSKTATGMWDKVRKAWRYTLPDLETGTHFKILDRDLISPYEKGGKYRYECSDDECDIWANLFGYDESNPWRFKFAIDSVSLSLNDISIALGNLRDNSAWQEFMKSLSISPKDVSRKKQAISRWWKKAVFSLVTVTIVVVATTAIWHFYLRSEPPVEVVSIKKMAFPLPDKPSIAVLPFDNLSGDPEQEYFCDGLTEDVITALSKVPNLFVIARHSVFTYRGKPINIKQVADQLGIRYVLEGTVRKTGERIRITAQLIDSMKGDHLWAERYDRTLEDIFSIQDEITMNIVMALQVKLTEGEKIRVFARSTDNLMAYQKYIKGRAHWLRINSDDNAAARQLFEEAIALDPEYSTAYVDLAWTYLMDIHFGVSKSPKESVERAAQLVQKAISLDETSSFANSSLGSIFAIKKQFEEAIVQGEKAVALNPNDSLAKAMLGRNLAYMGRYEEALLWLDKAIRLDPIPLTWYYTMVGHCYLYMGRYEEALEEFKKALHRNPKDITANIRLTAVYSLLGWKKDASAAATEVLRINPKFRIESIAKWPYKNKADRDLLMNALRNSGLK